MTRLWIALGLSLSGCGDRLEHVAWPELDTALPTAVVIVERSGAPPEASAHLARELPELELDAATGIWLLGYVQPIEAIGAGRLDPSAPDLGCFLSFPRVVLRFEAGASEFSLTALTPNTRAFLDGGRTCLGCLDFTEARIDLEAPEPSLGLPLPGGAALVQIGVEAGAETRLIEVGRDGRSEPLSGCEGRSYWSGVAEGDGVFWLGGSDGRLDKVEIDLAAKSCTVALSTQTPSLEGLGRGALRSLSLTRRDGEAELWSGSDAGRFERFHAREGWTFLGQLVAEPGDTPHGATVATLGSDEALLALGGDQLLHWRRIEGARTVDVDLGPALDVSRPPWISTLGVLGPDFLIGDSEGRVSRWPRGETVEPLPLPTALGEVGFIRARGAGLVALAESGRVLQVHDGGEACDEVYTIAGSFRSVPRAAFVEPDGAMFVADAVRAGGVSLVVWLTPR